MEVSNDCINAIKRFEGFLSKAYKCPAGVWTIGYGHTANVKKGMVISLFSAEQQLKSDLHKFEAFINGLNLDIDLNQFDALVDFTFNVGSGNFLSSTLYQMIKANDNYVDCAKQFKRWVYAGNKVLPGLVTRRDWEYNKYIQQ